jgi:tRNA A-37 threonylcarbamoyl transferase component Bud32
MSQDPSEFRQPTDLAEILAERGPLSASEAVHLVRRIASQTAALHADGRLHRGICPSAVVVDESGEPTLSPPDPNVSVADLLRGGCDVAAELADHPRLELPDEISTANQALTAAGIDLDPRRIDLYQLGALLCRIVTGDSLSAFLRSPKAKERTPTSLQPIIERAIGYNSADRFESCDDLIRDLDSVDPDAEESPFERLGHYQILDKIGYGGMGDVYRGYEESLDRTVAIKVLPPALARDPDLIRRFQAEATAAAKLNHPNVVQIHFIGDDANHHFFAMQYVDGESLADLLAREGRLNIDRTLGYAEQCLAGLEAAHEQGLVHRDVKPANILIDQTSDQIRLADFGLARAINSMSQMTATGVILGTVDYLSPEQGRGGAVDGRSDLYSLGVVIYQMLTGRLPFQADSPTSMIFQHAYEPAPPLGSIDSRIPSAIAAIVRKLLDKDPARRYQTAAEVLSDIEAFRAGRPVSAMADTPPPPVGPAEAVVDDVSFDELDDIISTTGREGLWSRIVDIFRAQAHDIRERIQTTQVQIDGALAEHARRCNSLEGALHEKAMVIAELRVEARRQAELAAESASAAERATDTAEADRALSEKRSHEQVVEELNGYINEHRAQAAEIQARLTDARSTLTRLERQRDVLQARLDAAEERLERATGDILSRWRLKPLLVVAVVGIGVLGALMYLGRSLVSSSPRDAAVLQPITTIGTALSGQWSPAGSLKLARDLHTATVLPDGRVLVAGGRFGIQEDIHLLTNTCELYDPETGQWAETASFEGPGRYTHRAVLLPSGNVLVAGGTLSRMIGPSRRRHSDLCEIYDSTVGGWRLTGRLNSTRGSGHNLTLLDDGKVLLTGGTSRGGHTATCELYDPISETWTAAAPMQGKRAGHAAVSLKDGTVLVIAGISAGRSCERYDPSANKWSSVGDLNLDRDGLTTVLLSDGRVLVAGGDWEQGGDSVSKCEIFDPITETWSISTPLTCLGNSSMRLVRLLDGSILRVGGSMKSDAQNIPLRAVERFDPMTQRWNALALLSTQRTGHTVSLLTDGRVIAAGGFQTIDWPNNNTWTATCEIYAPATSPTFSSSDDPTLADLKPGLLVTEYPRLRSQEGREGGFVHPSKLGEPFGETYVVHSLFSWKYKPERNAAAEGFLRIDRAGEYAFRSVNFYDRNTLYIDEIEVCGYRDGEDKIARIRLSPGLHKFKSVGFVSARGSVDVQWMEPEKRELAPIPRERLFHSIRRRLDITAARKSQQVQRGVSEEKGRFSYLSGLIAREYPRHRNQLKDPSVFVPENKLGEPISEIVAQIGDGGAISFHSDRTLFAHGFLHVQQAGEYAFTVYGYNTGGARLIIGGTEIRQEDTRNGTVATFVDLTKGYAPIKIVGRIGNSGAVIKWKSPKGRELGPIPRERIFHRIFGVKLAGAPSDDRSPVGLIGRTTVQKKDIGLVFRYRTGEVFGGETVREKVFEYGGGMRRVRIELNGTLRVPKDMTVIAWLAGGSSSGGVHWLYVDGREVGSVGDDRVKNTKYRLPLKKGDYEINWILTGGDFGANSLLQFFDPDLRPLTVSTSKMQIEAAKAGVVKAMIENSTQRPDRLNMP